MRNNSLYTNGLACWYRLVQIAMTALCLLAVGCASQKTIINGLEERDANEILVFLSAKNISAVKIKAATEAGGGNGVVLWEVSVDSHNVTEAMALLNANGLPRKRSQRLLELFTTGGLVPSEMQEKIRYQAGLSEQISGTIRKIDGIIDADVQLSFPEEDPLNPKTQKAAVTASVFVKHQGVLDDPNSHLITKIRRLVSSSIQGLSFENVTVIADKARFSDATQAHSLGEVSFVKVWGLIVSVDSLGAFRLVVGMLSLLLVVFIIATLWLWWKLAPIARLSGGIGLIFSLHPLELHLAGENVPDKTQEQFDQELEESNEQENVEVM